MKLTKVLALSMGVLAIAQIAAAQTGTITGTVVDAVSLTPVPSPATMQLYEAGGGLFLGSVSTNGSGQYTFTGVPPGNYFVRMSSSPTYYSKLFDNIPCVADDCRITAGTPVTVTAGGTATANFALEHDRVFSGVVRLASNNQPVTTGTVQVFNASGSFVTSVPTGLDGGYVAFGLSPGIYYARATFQPTAQRMGLSELYGGVLCRDFPSQTDPLFFRRVDPACRIFSGTPISTVSANPINIDFALDPPATISGHVLADGTGTPLEGIVVAAYLGDVEVGRGQTVSGGGYLIGGLSPGFYRLRTISTGPYADEWHTGACVGCGGTPQTLAVGIGANIVAIDFALGIGGAITGQITCANAAFILGPRLSAFNASGELVRVLDTFCPAPPSVAVYNLQGLPSGQYYVLARDPLAAPFGIRPWGGSLVDKLFGEVVCNTVDCDVRRGVPITVTAGNTTGGIDFAMTLGAGSGEGFVSGTRPLRMFDSRGVEMVGVVRFVTIVGFTVEAVGLPPGTYYAKWGNTLHGGITCVDCPPTSGRPIVIRPGDLSFRLDFGPPSGGRRISGNVSDEGPQPLSTIGVELVTDTGMLVASALSDQFGNYRFDDVLAGTYFLRTRNDRGYADEVYQDIACASCDPRQGTPVVVSNADVSNVNFTIAPGGVIAGETRDTLSNAIANVPVSIFTSAGTLAGQAVSLASGTFRVNVPAGSYRARAEATPAHGAELFSETSCTSGACDVIAATPIAVTTGNVTSNVNFTLAACSAMTLLPSRLASGVVGSAYRQVMTVSGGTSPMRFRVTAGGLPDGIAFDGTTGVLSGTPTLSGRYELTVGVVDANACATARAFTLDVQECAFVLSPAGATLGAGGGPVTITIGGACGPQTVDPGTFVSVLSNTPGEIVLSVPPNPNPAPRIAAVTIGRRVFEVRQAGIASQPPFGSFDAPLDGSQVAGSLPLGGWALDDLEVRRVLIYRDPIAGEGGTQIFLGNAVFVRGARPDVARSYPTYPLNDRAGWGFLVLTNMLPNQGNGAVRIYAYADDAEGARTLLGAKTIIATNAGATDPFGAIDTPQQGATIAGSAYLNFGWALTPQPKIIPFDGSTIHVMVDGVSLGHPTYNLFRSDVSGLFPGLANSGGPVGYKVIDTTALAEGQHTLAWIVYDSLNAGAGIGSRYFNVANSADAQPADDGGVESGRHTESLASAAFAIDEVRLKPDATGRVELPLETPTEDACPATWAGYSVEQNTLGKLPVGATIDPGGTFYWQPGPGFIGTYELRFVRTACDGSKLSVRAKIVISPSP
jgi:hypothetical protein